MSVLTIDGKRPLKVAIATPCGDHVSAGYTKDLVGLTSFMATAHPEIHLAYTQVRGTILPRSRTALVRAAVEQQATHVLFIDADMRFPVDGLIQLLAHAEPIVAANYSTRRAPILPTAFHNDLGTMFTPDGAQGLDEATHAGMGFMLVAMEVFARMQQPWFAVGFNPRLNEYTGEDVFFCAQARRLGYHVMVDHDLSRVIRHVGETEWTHEHALVTRTNILAEQQAEQQTESQPPDAIERVLELVGALPSNGRPTITGDAHGPE